MEMDWGRAACAGMTELFFASDVESVMLAKRVCGTCSQSGPCLEQAILHATDGVWAGLDMVEIRKLRTAPRARARVVS